MILTCPDCATRFFADDHAIGAAGRRVKCDTCGRVWTATAASDVEVIPEEAPSPASEASTDVAVAPGVEVAHSPLFVSREAPRRSVKDGGAGRPWALGLVVVLFVVVAGMLVFQPAIEKAFPGAAAFYHSVGLHGGAASGA